MRNIAALILISFATSCAGASTKPADRGAYDIWLSLIQQAEGTNCPVEVKEIILGVIGNNGLTINSWLVSSCHGLRMYQVAYRPNESQPYSALRKSPCLPARPGCT